MKRLVIIRHAKTIPSGYDQDFERTLTERGAVDAENMGMKLRSIHIKPDLVIASPAVRTTQTAHILCNQLEYDKSMIWFEKKLYSGRTAENFVRMLQELEPEKETVMVIGHNPTVYYYISYLLDEFYDDVPTCSTVGITFDTDRWEDIEPGSGKLAFRFIPDMFR